MLRLYHKISCKRLLVIYRAKSTRNEALEISNNLRAMPLEKRHQIQARMGYEARKKNNIKYQTGNIVRIEVVGSGAHGAPRSVHLCIDSVRYLFNCGEGTQRLANEYKIKLTKIPHVFITYPSWENVSGLLGMALSLQTIGIPEFCLHGPKLVVSIYFFFSICDFYFSVRV